MVKKSEVKKKSNIKKTSEVEKMKSTSKIPTTKLVVYKNIPQYSLARTVLEVYKTDEENFTPYTPLSSSSTETSTNDTSEDEEEFTKGFTLHQGEILEQYHYANLNSCEFEQDYADMSDSGSFKVDTIDNKRFYKGVRVSLKKEWEAPNTTLTWEEMPSVLTGFITEQAFSEQGITVKVSGMTKLLEQKYIFEFSQMKRSEILAEVIKTAGLNPIINIEGLDDDITDFSNKSSSGSSSSSSSSSSSNSGESSGSATIDEAVKKAIQGKTDDLSKAKAIDSAFKSHVYYKYYWNCNFSDIEKAWNNAHLNCADGANVLCAMFRAGGLTAVIVHTSGHYIVKVTVSGKTYYTDNAASTGSHTSRPFGEVWRGITSGSEVGTKISA